MGTKRFITYSIFYMLAIGIFVAYSISSQSYNVKFLTYNLELPIAVWVILPVGVLAVLAVMHFLYYSIKVYVENRALARSYDAFTDLAKTALLGQKSHKKITNKWLKLPSEMFNSFGIWGDMSFDEIENEEIKEIAKAVSQIQKGEFVDIRKYKLDIDNPLQIRNNQNRLKKDPKAASEILKTYSNLTDDIARDAFDLVINNSSYKEIKRYPYELDENSILTILKRFVSAEDDLFMDKKDVEALFTRGKMSEKGYLEAAKILKDKLNPDSIIALFENLKDANQNAMEGYMYVLYEFQMIDKLRELLENTDSKEYQNFKILLFLRDNSKIVDSSILV